MPTIAWISATTVAGGVISIAIAGLFAFSAPASWVPALVSLAIGTLLGAAFLEILPHAIESTDKITDPERRLIHLSVARQKGFAAIRIENCFDGELKFEKGLPVTTKKDVLYHGFGVKSIQNAAAKYGGTATITTREGWFELRVLIPLGQPQQE